MENEFVCQYCGRICKNRSGKSYHENRCQKNPNKILVEQKQRFGEKAPFYGKTPWNKGLTKETDSRIKGASIKKSNYHKNHGGTFTGKKHTKETKKKISDSMTEFNHSDQNRNLHSKGGWYNDIYFMSTWELAYYIYQKDHNVNIKRCEDRFKYFYNEKYHYYTPDFIIDENQYVEIKGREKEVDNVKYFSTPNLIIVRYDSIKCMIEYVKGKYGVENIQELFV